LPLFHLLFDLLLNLVQLDAEVLQHGRRHSLALPNEAEENVLGTHVLVVEARGLFARHREYLAHPFREIVAVHGPSTCRMGQSIILPTRLASPMRFARVARGPETSRCR